MILQKTQHTRPLAAADSSATTPSTTLRQRPNRRRGFTLIEASLATVIIGVGFLAILTLIAAGTRANLDGAEMSTGVNLARSVREMAWGKPYTQLTAWSGTKYLPPKDSRGVDIIDLPNWEQDVKVVAVKADDVSTEYIDSNPDAVKITVTVKHNGKTICEMSWYEFNGQHT